MSQQFEIGLMWFRRDLRVTDNAALHMALKACRQLHCVFVFDRDILDGLPRVDRRVEFIRESLVELDQDLRQLSGHNDAGLIVQHAKAVDTIAPLAQELSVKVVFAAHDYEPQAVIRDAKVRDDLASVGIAFQTCKDHVIFERQEILTQGGTPYGVFTPYKNKWLATLTDTDLRAHDSAPLGSSLAPRPPSFRMEVPTLADLGFETTNLGTLRLPTGASGARQLFEDFFDRMDDYHDTRNFPSKKGPSYLSVHLRFGTVSIR